MSTDTDSGGIADHGGRFRFMRSVLAVVLLSLTITVGTSAQTQNQAHAFVPVAAAVVAPTVARTVLVPAARIACGKVCPAAWGAVSGAVVGAAGALWCAFSRETCTIPWSQNPDVPANSPGGSTGGYWTSDPSMIDGNGAVQTAIVVIRTDSVQLRSVNQGGWTHVRGECYSLSGSLRAYLSEGDNANVGCTDGYVSVEHCYSNGFCGGRDVYYGGKPEAGKPDPWNPERTGQGYRVCRNSAGDRVRLAGPPTNYQELQGGREMPLPLCPSSHPVPSGGGIVAGNPWQPDVVEAIPSTGSPAPNTTPLVPPLEPRPDLLPDAPATPEAPRRTLPGKPAKPLPDLDPVTGQPKPTPQPLPPTVPDEGPCMWGGYAVDPEDCVGAPAPEAPPTASPAPSSTPAPVGPPTSGENPDPEDGSRNCLGTGWSWNPVSWVYVPVKCVLLWAFVPKPGFVDGKVTGVRDSWGDTGPGRIIGATGGVVTKVGDLSAGAGGCSGPAVRFDTKMLKTTLRPLAACPGDLAHQAAKVVRIITTLGLYLGAAALVARILASSLGLQLPGFGRGDDA